MSGERMTDAALADALDNVGLAFDRNSQYATTMRKAAAALRARPQAVAAFVPYTDAELREWFPVMCNHCGWRGLSRDCTGGGPIADTGDFNEITCPQCWADGDGKAVDPREVVVVDGRPQAVAEGFERVAWQRVSDDGKPLPIFVTLREHLSPVCKYRDVLAALRARPQAVAEAVAKDAAAILVQALEEIAWQRPLGVRPSKSGEAMERAAIIALHKYNALLSAADTEVKNGR